MIKEKDILIRVTPELKNEIKLKATSQGLSVSAYIRFVVIKDLTND